MTNETVYTLSIDHKHGTDTRVFRSEQGALDALTQWARQWWATESAWWENEGPSTEVFAAMPDHEAVELYFERMNGRESYSLDSAYLED